MSNPDRPVDDSRGSAHRNGERGETAYAREMNAAQLNAVTARAREVMQKTLDNCEYRKLAMEAAIHVYDAQVRSTTIVSPTDPVALAREIYNFLVEPAVKIEFPADG